MFLWILCYRFLGYYFAYCLKACYWLGSCQNKLRCIFIANIVVCFAYRGKNLVHHEFPCKFQMTSKTKKPDMSIIAGCFNGLNGLLVNFTQSAEEGDTLGWWCSCLSSNAEKVAMTIILFLSNSMSLTLVTDGLSERVPLLNGSTKTI